MKVGLRSVAFSISLLSVKAVQCARSGEGWGMVLNALSQYNLLTALRPDGRIGIFLQHFIDGEFDLIQMMFLDPGSPHRRRTVPMPVKFG